jgi:hypothetical protein
MQEATTIGLDIAKSVFQVHGIDVTIRCRLAGAWPSRSCGYAACGRYVTPAILRRPPSSRPSSSPEPDQDPAQHYKCSLISASRHGLVI